MKQINEIPLEQYGGRTLEQMRQAEAEYLDRKAAVRPEMTAEQAAILSEYWKKVFAEKPARQSALMVTRSTVQEMDYEQARRKLWSIMEMRAAHIMMNTGNMDFKWAFTDAEKDRNINLLKYFINDPTCKFSLSKGLFLYGPPGTGKTELMNAFSKFTTENELTKRFEVKSMSEVYSEGRTGSNVIEQMEQRDRCFDEFGRITGTVLNYGNPIDLNEAIIEARYLRNKRYGQLTHIVTNATPNETETMFSPAVFDRLREMCTGIEFGGKSKRQ